jgi:hypothetical protein
VTHVKEQVGVTSRGQWLPETILQDMLWELADSHTLTLLERIWPLTQIALAIFLALKSLIEVKGIKMDNRHPKKRSKLYQVQPHHPTTLEVVSEYSIALAEHDSERTRSLHSPVFVLDWIIADAFETPPSSAEETHGFWLSGCY